ncbi:hypothetical protein Bca4012_103158 [Brassica carinata]
MLTLEPFSEDQGRSVVHPRVEWEPTGRRPSTQMRGTPWRVLRTTIKAAASPRPLGGIYRPIGAAFPNNPTRRQRLRGATGSEHGGLSPSLAPLSRNLGGPSLRRFSDYNSSAEGVRFSSWALPRVIRLTWGRVEDFGSSRASGPERPSILRGLNSPPHVAFKDSMVHGILQFTPTLLPNKHRLGLAKANCLVACSLTLFVRGAESAKRPPTESGVSSFSGRSVSSATMILPQEAAGGVYKGQGRSQRADDSRLLGIPR